MIQSVILAGAFKGENIARLGNNAYNRPVSAVVRANLALLQILSSTVPAGFWVARIKCTPRLLPTCDREMI